MLSFKDCSFYMMNGWANYIFIQIIVGTFATYVSLNNNPDEFISSLKATNFPTKYIFPGAYTELLFNSIARSNNFYMAFITITILNILFWISVYYTTALVYKYIKTRILSDALEIKNRLFEEETKTLKNILKKLTKYQKILLKCVKHFILFISLLLVFYIVMYIIRSYRLPRL